MIGKARSTWGPISLCLTLLGGIAGSAVAASFEPDTETFEAGNLVDKSILRGPNHTLRNKVINKGYMNNYVIDRGAGQIGGGGGAETRQRRQAAGRTTGRDR